MLYFPYFAVRIFSDRAIKVIKFVLVKNDNFSYLYFFQVYEALFNIGAYEFYRNPHTDFKSFITF